MVLQHTKGPFFTKIVWGNVNNQPRSSLNVSHSTLTWLTHVCRVTEVTPESVVLLALLDPPVVVVPPDLLEMMALR